ncbi:nucleoside deaminase [Alcaligenes endophyticus]|uniref:Nucleoside deaminase n=1 Tax=Alcaligenes endophyticus TaxID=1929088 RepID=A0ABT8EFM2_9BURK|nr:nucleoside deaminase [Alcaligenes endophyticus]MCX5590225.1 nucleoside deaminase [Alcaligenes endophyticus]MDN4120111.1 nucleoside deaminase [Alcaligenes endophyticus]
MKTDRDFLLVALEQARLGVAEGGMPFGSALVDGGVVVAKGRNRQLQDGEYFSHAETNCLAPYLKRPLPAGNQAVLYATEAPCPMCAGAALISGIRKIVVGENQHYAGAVDWLRQEGVDVTILNDQDCIDLVSDFKATFPEKWETFSAG